MPKETEQTAFEVDPFDVLKEMTNKNMDIKAFPLSSNLIHVQTGKDGWSRVTIAVDNNTCAQIVVGGSLVMTLLIADGKQFEEVKKRLSDGL